MYADALQAAAQNDQLPYEVVRAPASVYDPDAPRA
jgi:hypothetical protein